MRCQALVKIHILTLIFIIIFYDEKPRSEVLTTDMHCKNSSSNNKLYYDYNAVGTRQYHRGALTPHVDITCIMT